MTAPNNPVIMAHPNEEKIKFLISRHQQKIFSLVRYLIGGDKDRAYDITAEAFAATFQKMPRIEQEDLFLILLATIAIKKSRLAAAMPHFDISDFLDLPPERRKTLQITQQALQVLDFEEKVLLLLRDQLNLSYKMIATILKTSEKRARIQTSQACSRLREKTENILREHRIKSL